MNFIIKIKHWICDIYCLYVLVDILQIGINFFLFCLITKKNSAEIPLMSSFHHSYSRCLCRGDIKLSTSLNFYCNSLTCILAQCRHQPASFLHSARYASQTTVDTEELKRFQNLASKWWDEEGEFAALHAMNDLRVPFIRCVRACAFPCDVFENVKMSHSRHHGKRALTVSRIEQLWPNTTGSRFSLLVFVLSRDMKITHSASDSGPSHISTLSAFSFCFLRVWGVRAMCPCFDW